MTIAACDAKCICDIYERFCKLEKMINVINVRKLLIRKNKK